MQYGDSPEPNSGVCVEVHDYRLYSNAMDDQKANVWRVHKPNDGQAIDALNLDSFRTAGEIEAYLPEGMSSE